MKKCPSCDADLEDEAYACAVCAAALPIEKKSTWPYRSMILGAAAGCGLGTYVAFSEFLLNMLMVPFAPMALAPIICLFFAVIGMLVGFGLGSMFQRGPYHNTKVR